MPEITRRNLFRLGAASVILPSVGQLVQSGTQAAGASILLGEPSACYTYDEGIDGEAVPAGDGVVATFGAPAYSRLDTVHGTMGWLSAGASGGGRLVYANPSVTVSSGSLYLIPHTIAAGATATVVAFGPDATLTTTAATMRLTSDACVEVLDSLGGRAALSKPLCVPDQRMRLDWRQAWNGTTLTLTVWIYASDVAEGWRATQSLQASFVAAAPAFVALGQDADYAASIGYDTYREYGFDAVPAPFAPAVGGVAAHSFDEGSDGALIAAGANMVTGVSGSPRYAASAAKHGALGVLLPAAASSSFCYDNPYPPASTGSVYVRTLVQGGGVARILTLLNGTSVLAQVRLTSRGAVTIADAAGVQLAETASRAKLKTWARIDWQSTWDGSSVTLALRYYATDAESRDNYTEISGTVAAAATPDTIAIGTTATGWKLCVDSVRTYGDVSAWPAPVQPTDVVRAPGLACWAGDATQTTVEISAYTNDTTSVGLLTSVNADMSEATVWPSAPPNQAGWNKWSVTGLTAGTRHYHQLTDTPLDGVPVPISDVSTFLTLRDVGVAGSTRIAVGSCGQENPLNPAVFDDIVAWAPDRTVHLGDFGYPNNLSRDPSTHMNNWSLNCTDAGFKRIQALGCMDYLISDHDDNGTGNSNMPTYQDPVTMANLIAWQQVVPARMEDTQSPPHGRWRSEVEGSVRFVKIDTRTIDKTDTTAVATDPAAPSSTMLGAEQLSWLKAQLDAAAAARQLVVLFSDCAWNGVSPGPPIPVTFSDKWPSFSYERDLISDYAAAAGTQLFIAFGDSHGLQQDDGTNEKNGFASICCGPMDQELHMHYQDSYQWSYPDGIVDGGGPYRGAQQYQRLTITQEVGSSTVTVTAEARDCSPAVAGTPFTARTMTKSYDL